MADPVLHIKDAYFFEVPRDLWKRNFKSKEEVRKVSPVWVELDDQFQDWEAHRQLHSLDHDLDVKLPEEGVHHDWHEWVHPHDAHHEPGHHPPNAGKPFDVFLESKVEAREAEFAAWKQQKIAAAAKAPEASRAEEIRDAKDYTYADYRKDMAFNENVYDAFVDKMLLDPAFPTKWEQVKLAAADVEAFAKDETAATTWSPEKLEGYSKHLSGKILIPQPFGRLRNLHEPESGFTITKYMIVEVAVALIIAIVFSWLARRVISGSAPKGRLWNFLEVFVVFIRDQIAKPAIGGGHDDHHDDAHAHGRVEHGHHVDASGHAIAIAAHGHEHHGHGHEHHGHGHAPAKKHAVHVDQATRFTPLLCTIFFFVLGCNLSGMIPWVGSPTAVFGVTFALAMVTLTTVFVAGMLQFGFFGFFANQVPTMDMPLYMAVVLKPAIFLIEFGGLLIKHIVLSIRLLANMLAGHMVLLAIMGLAFGATAMLQFVQADGSVGVSWWITATIAVVGSALLSVLELFVAFLQAFVFTMLSALFIGASVHKH